MTDYRILLTDDNALNRKVVQMFMKPLGVTLVEACNGAEALELLQLQQRAGGCSAPGGEAEDS
jgi:CheY-like chemotaxis protein